MKAYKLALNEDYSINLKFYADPAKDVYKEALDLLGWSLLTETDENSEKQLKFNFFETL